MDVLNLDRDSETRRYLKNETDNTRPRIEVECLGTEQQQFERQISSNCQSMYGSCLSLEAETPRARKASSACYRETVQSNNSDQLESQERSSVNLNLQRLKSSRRSSYSSSLCGSFHSSEPLNFSEITDDQSTIPLDNAIVINNIHPFVIAETDFAIIPSKLATSSVCSYNSCRSERSSAKNIQLSISGNHANDISKKCDPQPWSIAESIQSESEHDIMESSITDSDVKAMRLKIDDQVVKRDDQHKMIALVLEKLNEVEIMAKKNTGRVSIVESGTDRYISPASETSPIRNGTSGNHSVVITPYSIYKEFEDYKSLSGKKIAQLDFNLKEERTKTSRFAVLNLENQDLKEKLREKESHNEQEAVRRNVADLKVNNIGFAVTQIVESATLDERTNHNRLIQTYSAAEKGKIIVGNPGYVRQVKKTLQNQTPVHSRASPNNTTKLESVPKRNDLNPYFSPKIMNRNARNVQFIDFISDIFIKIKEFHGKIGIEMYDEMWAKKEGLQDENISTVNQVKNLLFDILTGAHGEDQKSIRDSSQLKYQAEIYRESDKLFHDLKLLSNSQSKEILFLKEKWEEGQSNLKVCHEKMLYLDQEIKLRTDEVLQTNIKLNNAMHLTKFNILISDLMIKQQLLVEDQEACQKELDKTTIERDLAIGQKNLHVTFQDTELTRLNLENYSLHKAVALSEKSCQEEVKLNHDKFAQYQDFLNVMELKSMKALGDLKHTILSKDNERMISEEILKKRIQELEESLIKYSDTFLETHNDTLLKQKISNHETKESFNHTLSFNPIKSTANNESKANKDEIKSDGLKQCADITFCDILASTQDPNTNQEQSRFQDYTTLRKIDLSHEEYKKEFKKECINQDSSESPNINNKDMPQFVDNLPEQSMQYNINSSHTEQLRAVVIQLKWSLKLQDQYLGIERHQHQESKIELVATTQERNDLRHKLQSIEKDNITLKIKLDHSNGLLKSSALENGRCIADNTNVRNNIRLGSMETEILKVLKSCIGPNIICSKLEVESLQTQLVMYAKKVNRRFQKEIGILTTRYDRILDERKVLEKIRVKTEVMIMRKNLLNADSRLYDAI